MESGRMPLHARDKVPKPTKGRTESYVQVREVLPDEPQKPKVTEPTGFFRGARVASKVRK